MNYIHFRGSEVIKTNLLSFHRKRQQYKVHEEGEKSSRFLHIFPVDEKRRREFSYLAQLKVFKWRNFIFPQPFATWKVIVGLLSASVFFLTRCKNHLFLNYSGKLFNLILLARDEMRQRRSRGPIRVAARCREHSSFINPIGWEFICFNLAKSI